jgi:hypothetical protein
MKFQTNHGIVEIPDELVLQAAGRIYEKRRRTHAGGRPPSTFACRFCATECAGRRGLRDHERQCPAAEAALRLDDADLLNMRWEPAAPDN